MSEVLTKLVHHEDIFMDVADEHELKPEAADKANMEEELKLEEHGVDLSLQFAGRPSIDLALPFINCRASGLWTRIRCRRCVQLNSLGSDWRIG